MSYKKKSSIWDSTPLLFQSIKKKYKYESVHAIVSPKKHQQIIKKSRVYDYLKPLKDKRVKVKRKTMISTIFQTKLPKLQNSLSKAQKKDLQENRLFSLNRILVKLTQLLLNQPCIQSQQLKELYDLIQFDDLQQTWKKVKAFKQKKLFIQFKSPLTTILFHNLTAKLAQQYGIFEIALQSYRFCQYSSLKNKYYQLGMIYLWEQSKILMNMNLFHQSVERLKYALELSTVIKDINYQMKILYKIGVNYYYVGNSSMGQYYYQRSYKGLEKKERQIYQKEFDLNFLVKHIQSQIFKLSKKFHRRQKSLEKDDKDINKQNVSKENNRSVMHQQMVMQMLKAKDTIKDAQLMRKTMNKTMSLTQIKLADGKLKPKNHFQEAQRVLLQPIQNCTQVLKTHLSRDKSTIKSEHINNNWKQISEFIKEVYTHQIFLKK